MIDLILINHYLLKNKVEKIPKRNKMNLTTFKQPQDNSFKNN